MSAMQADRLDRCTTPSSAWCLVFIAILRHHLLAGPQGAGRAERPHSARGRPLRRGPVPTKIEKDAVTGRDTTGHEWDGLKELNTPLPKWWLYVLVRLHRLGGGVVVLYPVGPLRHRLLPRRCWAIPTRKAVDADVAAVAAQRAGYMEQDRGAVVRRHPQGPAAAGGGGDRRAHHLRRQLPALPRRRRRRPARLPGACRRRLAVGRHAGATSSRPSRTASAAAIPTRAPARCRASAPTAC